MKISEFSFYSFILSLMQKFNEIFLRDINSMNSNGFRIIQNTIDILQHFLDHQHFEKFINNISIYLKNYYNEFVHMEIVSLNTDYLAQYPNNLKENSS